MNLNYRRLLVSLLIGTSMLLNYSCAFLAGGAAGIGALAFIGGELKSIEAVPLDRAWGAAQKAIDEMGLKAASKEKDDLSARLVCNLANDKQLTINLKKKSSIVTEIGIRVGVFGNEFLSNQVLEKMRKQF